MTKSELISTISNRFPQLTHADAAVSIQTILDNMSVALENDNRIEIRGFGSFNVNTRSPRTARNPKTGKKVSVDAKRVPHFKAGLDLRNRVSKF